MVVELDAKNPNNQAVAAKIAATGNEVAKKRAGAKLVSIAEQMGGAAQRDALQRELQQANQRLGRNPSAMQLEEQVAETQTEKLGPIYLAMLEVGGDAAIEHGFKIAKDPGLSPKRRSQGLSVIERYVDPSDIARGKERAALSEEINKKLAASQQTDAQLADAAEVVAKLRDELTKCHVAAMKKTPNLSAKGTMTLKVDAKGAVTDAGAKDIEPPEFRACLEDAAKRAKFAAPAQATTLRVPLLFTSSGG